MKEVKEVTVSMNKRAFTIDFAIDDVELIEAIFGALEEYVKKDFPIKVKETYVTSLSDTARTISRIISNRQQMAEWRTETRQLISVIRKGK